MLNKYVSSLSNLGQDVCGLASDFLCRNGNLDKNRHRREHCPQCSRKRKDNTEHKEKQNERPWGM